MSFPNPRHDHGRCVSGALKTAENKSRALGLRFTKTRRKVLEILWQSHSPLGAYDILDRLQEDGRRPAPMVVYRALDFLMEAGLAHRLSSRNAFIGCSAPDDHHEAQFLICDQCGSAAEVEARPIAKAVEETAASAGFRVQHRVVEITGICPNCQN
ncbi:MAG: transcriptional repressor [Rhodospirillaceae bacterium]|jgi:Fur family transcriptional regulator, zinc uptake regulator|nr:transcriptional repressor [Rhodospirillaceae bacterium]MBT5240082.1 transcriptional repressor [Rhodospirillaceae bacterium]MBT5564755.1 transcriptional repressor [Rhodospirillaceae bacterium]MBT6088763.1 transcriptional repressor [Rhodospirillaceae bacterium]MBT7450401.1 transcriptional repressor [Rhodospirillaceae bacterium]